MHLLIACPWYLFGKHIYFMVVWEWNGAYKLQRTGKHTTEKQYLDQWGRKFGSDFMAFFMNILKYFPFVDGLFNGFLRKVLPIKILYIGALFLQWEIQARGGLYFKIYRNWTDAAQLLFIFIHQITLLSVSNKLFSLVSNTGRSKCIINVLENFRLRNFAILNLIKLIDII